MNTSEIKVQNRQSVYEYIRDHGPASRQDIVIGLGMSLPTVNQYISFLEEEGLISPTEIKKTAGRSAAAYTFVREARHAAGVFFSNHHITVVITDLAGEVVFKKREKINIDFKNKSYLLALGTLVMDTVRESCIPEQSLLGIGLAVPSLVSDDGERIIYGLSHDFTGITRADISSCIPYPTRMFHDASVAGFAEVWINKSLENALYLSLNDTVGSSLIIDHKIYPGDNSRSGEIGHIKIQPKGGKKCYCGKTGCFDTVCNANVLAEAAGGGVSEFFELLETGDDKARDAFTEYLRHLSRMIHNIRMLLDCPVILGGYIGAAIEPYLDDLCSRIDSMTFFEDPAAGFLRSCLYKNESTAAGAAIMLVQDFLQSV